MAGFAWKRNAERVLERRRRFFRRQMLDQILASLPVATDTEEEWRQFEARWGTYGEGETRPFPSNEEIFERCLIGLQARAAVEDDTLPVIYSILDAGESMVGAMFGQQVRFLHRPRRPAFSSAPPVVRDYARLSEARFSLNSEWTKRFLGIQDYFASHMGERFAQHPCLTMDAMNFAAEMRGSTQAYLDLYEHPDGLGALMEVGLDFNIRFQEAQMERTGTYADGSFVWLAGWVPFARAVSLSVDAYVICSVRSYVEFGLEYQSRLIEHFGRGLMHFHCNRADLAAEVARLPGLSLLQYGGDTRDPLPEVEQLPEMRRAAGEVPIMVACDLKRFLDGLSGRSLMPNVWYNVSGGPIPVDEANRIMDTVRSYRA